MKSKASRNIFRDMFILACMALLSGAVAQAGTTNKVGAGQTYTTIAGAIAAAGDGVGDVVSIEDTAIKEKGITVDKSLTITGKSAAETTVRADNQRGAANSRIFKVNAGKIVTIQNMTLKWGQVASGSGGAIQNNGTLTLQDCTLTANDCTGGSSSDHGGGALGQGASPTGDGATTMVRRCTFVDNTVAQSSVGGGAIYHLNGVMTIDDSTFETNVATLGNGGGLATYGGGSTAWGTPKDITVRNSTFSANFAGGGGGGGAYLAVPLVATCRVYNCTFLTNVAYKAATTTYGGGLSVDRVVEIYSCLFAGNWATTGNPFRNSGATCKMYYNIWEGVASGAINTDIGNQKQVTLAQVGVNLTLANNGGPTKTHALLASSLAINKGTNAPVPKLDYDQRGAGYIREVNVRADCGAYEYLAGPITLTYSTNIFHEAAANNGSVDTVMTVTLSGNNTFSGASGVDFAASKISISAPPAGLYWRFQKSSDTTLNVSLTNKASSHNSANSVSNLFLVFQDAAFATSPASAVGNYSNGTISIAFDDSADKSIAYSTNAFYEASANDGSIAATPEVKITSHSEEFLDPSPGDFVSKGWLQVSHLPVGLTAVVTRTSASVLLTTLTGKATDHNSASNVANLTFAFQSGAFLGNDASVVQGSTNTGLTIAFTDPALTYNGSGAFVETAANDGSTTNTFTITLAGDTFTGNVGDNFAGANVTASGQPSGLNWNINRDSATQLTVRLTGNASPHNAAQNSAALSLAFNTSAFAKSAASVVTNNSKSNYSIAFANPALSYSPTVVTEIEANDGSVTDTIAIVLAGDTFTGNTGDNFAGTKVLASNVPDGLTARLLRASPTLLTASFTGNASPHTASADKTNVTFAFQNSAFDGNNAAVVTNYTKDNLSVLFRESFYVNQSLGNDANDGLTSDAAHAWKTLTNAVTRAPASSFINVMYSPHTENNIVVNKSLIIRGQGARNSIIQAAATRKTAGQRIFDAQSAGTSTLTFRDLTLQYGDARGSGNFGGAVALGGEVNLVMERCTVRDNDSENAGGAIGAFTSYNNGTFLTIHDCTFSGNIANTGSGAIGVSSRAAMIWNSTFSGNVCTNSGAVGGAITLSPDAGKIAEIYNCTFFTNSVGVGGFGGAVSIFGAKIYASVFADNTVGGLESAATGSCGAGGSYSNCVYEGTWHSSAISLGGNISTNFAGVDPVLAYNGGPTMTHALLTGSAAIDACVLNPLVMPYDQRGAGYDRVFGAKVDAGAYEYGSGGRGSGTLIIVR